MPQIPTHPVLTAAKPYAIRFSVVYLGLSVAAAAAHILFYGMYMQEVLFDWVLGPISILTAIQMSVTNPLVISGSVVLFVAGLWVELDQG